MGSSRRRDNDERDGFEVLKYGCRYDCCREGVA